jgi:vacuolar-type H+-ATPase subunit E/Vma4
MEEAELEKEKRRKERVAKQKRKLVGYYQKVKDEAEKIQVQLLHPLSPLPL